MNHGSAVSIVMTFFLSVTMLLTGSIESVLGSKIVKSEAGAAPFPITFLPCSYYISLELENWQLHIRTQMSQFKFIIINYMITTMSRIICFMTYLSVTPKIIKLIIFIIKGFNIPDTPFHDKFMT